MSSTAKDNKTPAGDQGLAAIVSVFNRGTNVYTAEKDGAKYALKPGSFLDVPQAIADTWLTCNEHGMPAVVLSSSLSKASPAAEKVNAQLAADAAASANKVLDLEAQLAAANAKLAQANTLLEQATAPAPAAPSTAAVVVAEPAPAQ